MSEAPPEKFPRTFYVANAIELFERFGHYGMYIGLSLYLTSIVKMSDIDSGDTLGNFRLVGSLAPIFCGALADRMTFKRSLVLAFVLYAFGYGSLYFFPTPFLATMALFACGVGGAFLKPVVMGTVTRTSPPGRQREGFAIFYRMVNSGSVLGKTSAYATRFYFSLRHVALNSVIASMVALLLSIFMYEEPERGRGESKGQGLGDLLRGYKDALSNKRLVALLVLMSGYYFMIEQFYMTFPKYVTRHIDAKAPLEIITLVNPALIALLQVRITKATRAFSPLPAMTLGMFAGALSMLLMGVVPGLIGACVSAAVFAVAEMLFSPRFYDTVARFAPPGKEGLYMGLIFIPSAIGAKVGGLASGRMIAAWLPAEGARHPIYIWGAYAVLGAASGLVMLAAAKFIRPPKEAVT